MGEFKISEKFTNYNPQNSKLLNKVVFKKYTDLNYMVDWKGKESRIIKKCKALNHQVEETKISENSFKYTCHSCCYEYRI